MTQDTEDVVARVAEALWTQVEAQTGGGWPVDTGGDDDLTGLVDDILDFKELARAALEASGRQSLSDRIDVLTQALETAARALEFGEYKTDAKAVRAALHQEGIAP